MFRLSQPSHRVLGGAVIATLVLGSAVGAEAATKKKVVRHTRTVTYSYTAGCGRDLAVVVGDTSPCGVGTTWDLTRQKSEKYLTITVKDQSGRPVEGEIWLSGGTGTATDQNFCGSLKSYQMGQDNYSLDINSPAITPKCPGTATSGTVTIAFSNLP